MVGGVGTPGDDEATRFVRLEWDRGHETLVGLVRSVTDAGLVISPVHELAVDPGFVWIRGDELLSVEDLDDDDPVVRHEQLRRQHSWEPVGRGIPNPVVALPLELEELLDELAAPGSLIMFHTRRTGSDEGLVGRVRHRRDGIVSLDEVDPSGRLTGDTLTVETDELIAIKWCDGYLAALSRLLMFES